MCSIKFVHFYYKKGLYMSRVLRVLLLWSVFASSLIHAEFLMPQQAFKPFVKVNEQQQIVAGVKIAKSIYLYEKELKIELLEPQSLAIASIKRPNAVTHGGEKVFTTTPEFVITLKKVADVSGIVDAKVKISYQGCSEEGLCYEPSQKIFTVKIDTDKLTKITRESATPTKELKAEQSETDMIADTIKSSSFLVVLATFFVFGVLLSLTPCVFPMIPIISGLIISQGEGLTTKKAFLLSLVYVLAMALAYTIAGILAGLFGANLQAALQNPWVVYSFAAVFVALALSMFGYYELKLPDALVNRVSQNSNRSGFVGVAIMGFLSALIVGPCVAAPLAGALVYIGQTGDAFLGGAALFVMSLGMGLPLIVVGVSAGKFMPKPGAWMTLVNAIFGVLMLGVAVWMLEKVLSFEIIVLLYSFLGLGFSLYLGVKEGHIFKRSVALILFIYSLALFISVLAGAASMREPLGFVKGVHEASATKSKQLLTFQVVTSKEELQKVLEQNRGKKILLDFSAKWCTACKELEEVTFKDPRVVKKMQEFVLVRADLTQNTPEQKALAKAYGVFGPPVILFFDANGKLLESKRIVGFVAPEAFLKRLDF
jgi:thiol:disulfide interchange protein DsbD